MALFKESKDYLARREKERAAAKQAVVDGYGETLGEALFNYVHGEPSTFEDETDQRVAFAKALVDALESSDYVDRITGMAALLKSIEAKIEPVSRTAFDAYSHDAPIR